MRRYFIYILLSLLVIGCFGCGNNKTKNKIMGTDVVNEGSTDALVGGEEAAKVTKELHQKKANKVVLYSLSSMQIIGSLFDEDNGPDIFGFFGFEDNDGTEPPATSATADSNNWYTITTQVKARLLDENKNSFAYAYDPSLEAKLKYVEIAFTNYNNNTGTLLFSGGDLDMTISTLFTYTDGDGNTFTTNLTELKLEKEKKDEDMNFVSGTTIITTSLGGYVTTLNFAYVNGTNVYNGNIKVGEDKLCDVYLTAVDGEGIALSGYYIWKDGTKYDL